MAPEPAALWTGLYRVVAPVTAATITFGQSGFFAAALITAGIRLAGSRPLLSGVLFGLLSYKPQLSVLVPMAPVAAGYWRTLVVACATVVALAAAATTAFGWEVWAAWIAMLPDYQAVFDGSTVAPSFMPNVLGNMETAGVALFVAQVAQAITSIAVAVVVACCFRRKAGRLAAAALLVGTMLATPHALIYDMPMVLAGMALFIEECVEAGTKFSVGTVSVLVLAMTSPLLMLLKDGPRIPVSALALLLLFGTLMKRIGCRKYLHCAGASPTRRAGSASW